MMNRFKVFLELEVRDRQGKVIQRHKQRSHSWVRNAYNMLLSELAEVNAGDSIWGAGYLNIKDTGGTLWYGAYPIGTHTARSMLALGYGYMGAAGSVTNGIVVGSGTAAESFEDYVLQTLIANGISSGQLSYVASAVRNWVYDAGTKVYTISYSRYMNNNSGGIVSVNEVGLIVSAYVAGNVRQWYMSRDKLASTVNIPDTGQLKVTYTIKLTFAG